MCFEKSVDDKIILTCKVKNRSTQHMALCSIPAVWRDAGQGEEGRLEGKKKSLKTAFEKKPSSFSISFRTLRRLCPDKSQNRDATRGHIRKHWPNSCDEVIL